MARLLILTLSSGEAALAVQSRQLANQSFQDFEHEIISGLPNQAAHNRLYRTIMDKASSFDLFMKLDGDMTFRRTALRLSGLGLLHGGIDARRAHLPLRCHVGRDH